MRRIVHPVVFTIVFALTACSSRGPSTIPDDRFDYNTAIADSWKTQMLLNMVRLRYGDPPLFLDVTSIIAQYIREGGVSAGAGLVTGGNGSLDAGVHGRWSDRPTITYAPIAGEQFTRSLMTPAAPGALLAFVQAGWSPETVFMLAVQSINGLSKFSPRTRALNPEFLEVVRLLSQLTQEGAVRFRLVGQVPGDGEQPARATMAFTLVDGYPDLADQMHQLRASLELDPAVDEYEIIRGNYAAQPDQIAIRTDSVLQMLTQLSRFFEVPAEHVEQGRARLPAELSGNATGYRPPIRVRVTESRPHGAYAAVENRGYWFSIDDTDIESKMHFSFLMLLLSLAGSGAHPNLPVITVGTGS